MNQDDFNKNEDHTSDNPGNFELPENYFDAFSSRLFKKIEMEEELNAFPTLKKIEKKVPFSTPLGYFDNKEELIHYPHLSTLLKRNPFFVPDSYFEQQVEISGYPLLFAHRKNPFQLPLVYFDQLEKQITEKVSLLQEKESYPVLYKTAQGNAFTIPDDYFSNFKVQKEIKIVSLYTRVTSVSYRVAAAIVLLLGLSILFYQLQGPEPAQKNDCNSFACLDKNEILNSGYVLRVSEDNIIDLLDENTLTDSLSLHKNGKTEKIDLQDVSDNVDMNTLTDNL